MTKKWLLILFILAWIFLSSCAKKGVDLYLGRGGFSIDYEWGPENLCREGISPRIQLNRVPGKTRMLEVKLVDVKMPGVFHGQGVLPYSGGDYIRANALRSYAGPCPKPGQIRLYVITVSALDANGKVLSKAEKYRECTNIQ